MVFFVTLTAVLKIVPLFVGGCNMLLEWVNC